MADTKTMSEYERIRQERIKENQKMLEELFPEGTDIIRPKARARPTVKRRRLADANSLGTESRSGSEVSDGEGSPRTKRVYQER